MIKLLMLIPFMLIYPVYAAYFLTLIWSMTASVYFSVPEITTMQAYAIAIIPSYVLANKQDTKVDSVFEQLITALIYPPIATGSVWLITSVFG